MSRLIHFTVSIFTMTSLLLVTCHAATAIDSKIIEIKVKHPSQGDEVLNKQLFVHLDTDGHIRSYSMEVDSVICLDVECEVIPVRLYWDIMGRYSKYVLPHNGQLTKTDHIVFSKADYEKLDTILGDRSSLLRDLSSDRIVEPGKAIETADGISAPTPVSLQHEVVVGAAYTCYTLWHWVNGEVLDKIHEVSEQKLTNDQILELYRSGQPEKVEFSLKHLQQRGTFSQDILNTIATDMASHGESIRNSLEFLMEASATIQSDVYFEAIETVFEDCGKTERTRILESLTNCKLEPVAGFYDRLSRWFPALESYYETHLLLELQEQYNAGSAKAVQNALPLLENPNFLIARRAYWFLMDQDLDPDQAKAIETFRSANSDRL